MSQPLDAMKGWINLVTGLQVIYANDPEPSAPSPKVKSSTLAYAAIDIPNEDSRWSTMFEQTTDTAAPSSKFVMERDQPREGILEIEIYGPGAVDYQRQLELSIGRPDVMTYFDNLGDYSIKRPTEISDEPVLRSATRDPGAELAFVIEWIESDDYNTEAVETIETTVDIDEE